MAILMLLFSLSISDICAFLMERIKEMAGIGVPQHAQDSQALGILTRVKQWLAVHMLKLGEILLYYLLVVTLSQS